MRLCEMWIVMYGSCQQFPDFALQKLSKIPVPFLRSNLMEVQQIEEFEEDKNDLREFLTVDSIVSVAPDSGSRDPFWLIKIQSIKNVSSR